MAPRKAAKPKKTAQYYKDNPEAYKKKLKYDTEDNKSEKDKKYRSELNQERRKRGVYGKGGDDMSHTKDGKIVSEDPSTNRARNRGKK
jgi:hypothetical protein